MNSSGIKKGLAVSAISALAVTGVPALSGSASAAVNDDFTVVSTGPALNGGAQGAVVVIRAQDGEITPALLNVTGTANDTAGSEDTGSQTVTIASVSGPVNDTANPAFEFITVRIAVTTPAPGGTATFRLFEDDTNPGTLDASEARQPVSISTAGPVASVDVTPASQTTTEGVESGDYVVTVRDSGNRVTQLAAADSLTLSETTGNVAFDDGSATPNVIESAEIADGTATFTGTAANAGSYTITVQDVAVPTARDTAILAVTEAANIGAGDINVVTGADSWNGFGDGPNAPTLVRADQNVIRFDIDGDNLQAGDTVTVTANSNTVTFGGQDNATATTTLDAQGNGSVTLTVDAASIVNGDSFVASINGVTDTFLFQTAAAAEIDGESDVYVCQIDAACTVTAVVLDQFGNPVTTGFVEASRAGSNPDATPQRKAIGSDGTVDFTFTDVNAVNNGIDTVTFEYFAGQFDATPTLSDSSTTIRYTTDGRGNDYAITLDGTNTEAPNYTADDESIIPLTDTEDDGSFYGFGFAGDENAEINLTNGEPGARVTLSVDNGALILDPDSDELSEGAASVEATLDGAGQLPGSYRIIGTTSGLVTLTVASANRTETAQLTVEAQDEPFTARNISVSGPAEVDGDVVDQITYSAVVTDAFGNPIEGFDIDDLNIQVEGPGEFQDGDAESDANGMIDLNVGLDEDANGSITITVTSDTDFAGFGADADRLFADSTTDDGEGLSASMDSASASTTVTSDGTGGGGGEELPVVDIDARLTQVKTGSKVDKLKVTTTPRGEADFARVNLFRINKAGKRVLVESSGLNSNGIKRFQVPDTNGKKATRYVARIRATFGDTPTEADTTGVKRTNTVRTR